MTQLKALARHTLRAGGALTLVLPLAAVTLVGCPSGGVGDPCTPEDEFREDFPGFTLDQEFIESRSFQCQTRICLVNHFQGRTECPLGQPAPTNCINDDSVCPMGETCQDAGAIFTSCDPTPCDEDGANPANCNSPEGLNPACGNRPCDVNGEFCECVTGECPEGFICARGNGDDADNLQCRTRVCAPEERSDDRCYIPGTDVPVAVEVCGQCAAGDGRGREEAVYCSCRCGPPDSGASEADENFNFCECPEGFTCEEIRPNVGLADAQLAGKYCIREGTRFEPQPPGGQCRTLVEGGWPGRDGATCEGVTARASDDET